MVARTVGDRVSTRTASGAYRLVRAPSEPDAVPPVLDADQQIVVDHAGGPLLVLAGPGTGKTTTIVEAVAARIAAGIDPEQILALTFSRRAAAELRERITARVHATVREPLARTFHSYAYGLLRRVAQLRGEPPPRLLTGAEQDLLIRELLAGDRAGEGIDWPDDVRAALATAGFAGELRDLVLRCVERQVTPTQLRQWGRAHRRPEWVAAGDFLQQYLGVTSLAASSTIDARGYDPAELVRGAGEELRADRNLLHAESERLRWVFVDEYQDVDPAQVDLLELLVGAHGNLVVVGDPDQSIYRFRGTDASAMGDFRDRFRPADGGQTPQVELSVSRRSGVHLLGTSRAVARGLPGVSAHRGLLTGPGLAPGEVAVHVFSSVGDEAAWIAERLRAAHLAEKTPWSGMAVLVRSTQRSLPTLRRALGAAGVPVAVSEDDLPLADQPAAATLLLFLRAALDPDVIDEPVAEALLTSPLGRADSVDLRRLRRQLRQLALEARRPTGGFGPAGSECPGLIASALAEPESLVGLPRDVGASAAKVADLLRAVRTTIAAGGTAEDALWALWQGSGLGGAWFVASSSGGPRGEVADRDLDAVLALFAAAGRFVDRLPHVDVAAFIDHVAAQQIPADAGAPRAPRGDSVRVLTAHAAKGLEWDIVAVAGVQEGSWPDLRHRGTLLGTADLTDLASGLDLPLTGAGMSMLAEERRLFYVAVTRARRRLLVTAVDGASRSDDVPSRFLDLVDPLGPDGTRQITDVIRPTTLPALVVELRRVLEEDLDSHLLAGGDASSRTSSGRAERGRAAALARKAGAARALRRLADAGVEGADPASWWGLVAVSDDGPLVSGDEPVRVSPSKLDRFLECPLRWLLETAGATTSDGFRQAVGTALHDVAEAIAAGTLARDEARVTLTGLMAELDPSTGWVHQANLDKAHDMLNRFLVWLDANPRQLVATEEPFEVQIGRAQISGRVDRLERDSDGHLVVVDLKTGSSKVPGADLPRYGQLGVYQVAVAAGGFGADESTGGAVLVQLRAGGKSPEQRQGPITDDPEPDWVLDSLATAVDGMSGAAFLARANAGCDRCPTRRSCPLHATGAQVTR